MICQEWYKSLVTHDQEKHSGWGSQDGRDQTCKCHTRQCIEPFPQPGPFPNANLLIKQADQNWSWAKHASCCRPTSQKFLMRQLRCQFHWEPPQAVSTGLDNKFRTRTAPLLSALGLCIFFTAASNKTCSGCKIAVFHCSGKKLVCRDQLTNRLTATNVSSINNNGITKGLLTLQKASETSCTCFDLSKRSAAYMLIPISGCQILRSEVSIAQGKACIIMVLCWWNYVCQVTPITETTVVYGTKLWPMYFWSPIASCRLIVPGDRSSIFLLRFQPAKKTTIVP